MTARVEVGMLKWWVEEDDQQFQVGCQACSLHSNTCREHRRSAEQDVDIWQCIALEGLCLCLIIQDTEIS